MRNAASTLTLIAVVALAIALTPAAARAGDEAVKLFEGKCAACHAKDGSGSTPMGKKMGVRDLGSPEVQKQTDAQLTEITAKGKGKMPGYEKKLTAEEIKSLVACVRAFAKK